MNENAHKYLDELAKKVITNAKVESPSFNFTNAVMAQVELLNKKQTVVYKPLISKRAWILITIGFLSVIGFILGFGEPTESTSWLGKVDFSVLSNYNLSQMLPNLKVSKTVMYSVLFFGVMIFIQIPLLKNHFDKRFEV